MTKLIAATLATLCFSPACGLMTASTPKSPDQPAATETAQAKPSKAKLEKAKEPAAKVAEAGPEVGDFFVHRFSGSFRATPLVLTEEVVLVEDGVAVVDYTLVDGAQSYALRVRRHLETGEIAQVSELHGDVETDAPIGAYEALLAKTMFSPDVNLAKLEESNETCLIGPEELDCQVNKYRVFVGDTEATLSVTRSDDLPGRDISGEIVAVDGNVLYRAELIESGRGAEISEGEVASAK
jgi:hypothetical protein